MSKRREFRPSALDLGPLEDRITLSHAGVTSHVAAHALTLSTTAHGKVVTVSPPQGEAGGTQTATLAGNAQVPKLGGVRLTGNLSSNGSLPPPSSNTNGTVTLVSNSKRAPGSVVLALTGPSSNLAPTHRTATNLTFTVQSATGAFAPYVGDQGSAILVLQTRHRPHSTTSVGNFTLTLSIRIP